MMKLIKIAYFFLASTILYACTSDFEEINTNPRTVNEDRINVDFLLTRALVYGALRYNIYQRSNELFPNTFMQYHAISVNYFETGRYMHRDDWAMAYYNWVYTEPGTNTYQIISLTRDDPQKINQTAIARIWKVVLMHRMTDFFGDVPYFEAFQGVAQPTFDRQEEIYKDMLNELKEAAQALDPSITGSAMRFGAADVLYNDNLEKWVRFANSLRLRLAMRISDVDPATAEQYVREVLDEGRIMNDNQYSARLEMFGDSDALIDNQNPIFVLSRIFTQEYRMGRLIMEWLVDYNDPRLIRYAEPAASTGQYTGLTNGLSIGAIDGIDIDNFSKDGDFVARQDHPIDLMLYSEVKFLEAEAALKGWGPGDPRDHYEQGIRASMEQYEITDAEAIDSYLSQPDIAYDATRTIEQIITQKWLAIFNNGFEAWAEYRRTGYPVLYEIASPNESETDGKVPVRARYPAILQSLNRQGLDQAIRQQGPDLLTTRMWWDVNEETNHQKPLN